VALFTIQELADYLGTSVNDAQATLLRDLTLAAMRSVTGMTLSEVSDDVVLLPASDSNWLSLPERPASEPTLVEVGGDPVTDWTFDTDRLYRSSGWQAWDSATGAPQRVRVTYTHGYQTFPDELKRIALQAAGRALINPSGLRSETIGSESYTYAIETVPNVVALTAQEKRELRRFFGSGGAYSIDTVPTSSSLWRYA
jgi:hypothetical protein